MLQNLLIAVFMSSLFTFAFESWAQKGVIFFLTLSVYSLDFLRRMKYDDKK